MGKKKKNTPQLARIPSEILENPILLISLLQKKKKNLTKKMLGDFCNSIKRQIPMLGSLED